MRSYLLSLLLLVGFASSLDVHAEIADTVTLETVYGTYQVTEPVLIELIEHPMMQRLKKVRQYGVSHFVIKPEEYNRYEHSIGVFLLLRRFGADLHEQIAGLLHDVSHTVFSHVGDWVFRHRDGKDSYQDKIHDEFLIKSGLQEVLKKHGLSTREIHHKQNKFAMLEQRLPDLCADRIEYNLQGGLREGLITVDDLDQIVQDLSFCDGNWFFTDPATAKKFAAISLYHTQHVWGSRDDLIVYMLMGKLLSYAVDIGYITLDEVHFGTDDLMRQHLHNASDDNIKRLLKDMKEPSAYYSFLADEGAVRVSSKFRGVDPLVKVEDGFKRLTELDNEYERHYDAIKREKEGGCWIKKSKD